MRNWAIAQFFIEKMKLIRGQKLKMSQLFDEKGNVIPITIVKLEEKEDFSAFQEGDKVKISGTSKGKGFAGGVKKWGFSGRDATHGVKHEHRTIGSVGSAFPERVFKGKKMPGRMGAERVTVKNLKIVKIDKEKKILMIKGAVPGHKGTPLEIRG